MYIDGIGNIEQMYNDIHIIPDKHNTGCDMNTCVDRVVKSVMMPQGIKFRSDSGSDIYIDWNLGEHKNLEGVIVFENIDFTNYTTRNGMSNTWGYAGNGVTVRFVNCNFSIYTDPTHNNELVTCEFINCSFNKFAGSYSTFEHCYFGGQSGVDAINPDKYCTFNNCYCSDCIQKSETQGLAHMDGMQSNVCKELYFNNCRWEVPDINYSVTPGEYSYAIFIQPINGAVAENVVFDHCYINGGGYYSISVTADVDLSKNIRIVEPFIGYCYNGNSPFYPSDSGNKAEAATENYRLHDSLYVSSVWKDENNKLHFFVTNDTEIDRTLTVHTNKGTTSFVIPRTYKATEYEADTKDFADLPIDIEHIIETDVNYAVFYENNTQIRFVDFGGEESKTYETVNDLFKDICDAIREKTLTTDTIKHIDIPAKIRSL